MEDHMIKVGEVFFIKDNICNSKDIHVTNEYLNKYSESHSNQTVPITSIEENCENVENYYSNLIKDGYSIIRKSIVLDLRTREAVNFQIDCFIADNINSNDYKIIYDIYSEIDNQYSTPYKYIYNYFKDKNVVDYDYIKDDQSNPNYSMIQKLDILMREKLHLLTDDEKKQISDYRNFNLEDVLTKNFKGNIINHGNGASIVITENNIYKKTLTKIQHSCALKESLIADNLSFSDSDSIWDLSENTNSILIQLALNHVIIWANPIEKRTQFQKQELSNFINEVLSIKSNYNDLDCSSAICENSSFYSVPVESLINDSSYHEENDIKNNK